MKALRNVAAAAMLMIIAAPAMIVSAEPLHKRVNFSINVPFEIKKSNVVLPAGNYILFQISQTDPNLFALYKGDLQHSPIAMLRTVRIDYNSRGYPDETQMLLSNGGETGQSFPVIKGWTIPGMDGWEITSAVTDYDRIERSKYALSRANYKKSKMRIKATASGY